MIALKFLYRNGLTILFYNLICSYFNTSKPITVEIVLYQNR